MDSKTNLKTICILHLFMLFINGIPTLSAQEKTYNIKPYDFAASEIMKNKIVMLAENGALGHYNLFPYITFINVIKSWNLKANKNNFHNKTLTLIVEKSPSAVKLIQHYIDSNDLNAFLDKMGNISSLEELYLFYKLRELSKEMARNKNTLKLAGFELDERYEDEYFFKKTDEERNNFIAKDRDSLLYENINSYLRNNPDEYILITYGNAHLDEEYATKISPAENCDGRGYYLAYYLRKKFGNKFVTIDQTFIDNESSDYGNVLAYLKDKNFLIKKGDPFFLGKIPFSELKADFTIIKHDGLVGPRFLRYVFSRNCLIRNYNFLNNLEKLCKEYNKTFSLKLTESKIPKASSVLQSIKLITGKEFNSLNDFKNYLDSTENNYYHERIFTEEISNILFNYLNNNPHDSDFRNMLYSIGFAPWYTAPTFMPSKEEWETTEWGNALPYLNYFDNVGLFWIGNTPEKEKAKNYLVTFTKQTYTEAADYLEWYYKNIFEYNFDFHE